MFVVPFS